MSGAYSTILVERIGAVEVITLNDPATLNAASFKMAEDLLAAFKGAAEGARAILLTGAGRGFCSGANLSGDLDPNSDAYDAGGALDTHYNPLMRMFRDSPVPIVTAVNGAAAGIGCSMALAGDIVLASPQAYFLQAFRRIGLVPDGGSAYLLAHSVGRARAMEMMLLGEKIPAEQALAWGLINRIVPAESLKDQAMALATDLASGPTHALAGIRKQLWAATESTFDEALARERGQQREAGLTSDHREGIAAFLQKRIAQFTGK